MKDSKSRSESKSHDGSKSRNEMESNKSSKSVKESKTHNKSKSRSESHGGASFIEKLALDNNRVPSMRRSEDFLEKQIGTSKPKIPAVINRTEVDKLCGNDMECHATADSILSNLQQSFRENAEMFKKYDDNRHNVMPGRRRIGGPGMVTKKLEQYVSDFYDATKGSDDQLRIETAKELQRALRANMATLTPASQLMLLQDMQNTLGKSLVLIDPYSRSFDPSLMSILGGSDNTGTGEGSSDDEDNGGSDDDGDDGDDGNDGGGIVGGGSPIKYNFNDLYTFLSDHFENELNSKKKASSPFYQPFHYPVQDLSIDTVLAALIAESPYQKFLRLYDQYKNKKSKPEVYVDQLKSIYKRLTDPSNVSNPWYLTKFLEGQDRPMETYRNEEFMSTLNKFSGRYASEPQVTIKKVQVETN